MGVLAVPLGPTRDLAVRLFRLLGGAVWEYVSGLFEYDEILVQTASSYLTTPDQSQTISCRGSYSSYDRD
jgi:hypothetical protein